jgi:uncharacterized protein
MKMSLKIDNDLNRFKDIVRGRVKNDVKRLISSEHLLGSVGGKNVKIPISSIDLPRFIYGNNQGGAGAGDGEPGDEIGGQKGKKPGRGEAGEDEGDHLSMEFTPSELAKILSEALELPDLLPKGKGGIQADGNRYNGVNPQGVICHSKRTFKEAMKRQISSGDYNYSDPVIVPIKRDFRYKTSSPIDTPSVNALLVAIVDISGSMDDTKRHLCKSMLWWTELLLRNAYKDIAIEYIVHDTKAWSVPDSKTFYELNSGGGTQVSSALKHCYKLIQDKYPFDTWNTYIIASGDGENVSSDNDTCVKILKEQLIPNCNIFNFVQIKAGLGEDLYKVLDRDLGNKIKLSSIDNEDDILKAIKQFFSGGL